MSRRSLKFAAPFATLLLLEGTIFADAKSELQAQQAKKKGQQHSQQAHAGAQEELLHQQQLAEEGKEKAKKKKKAEPSPLQPGPAGELKDVSAAGLPQR